MSLPDFTRRGTPCRTLLRFVPRNDNGEGKPSPYEWDKIALRWPTIREYIIAAPSGFVVMTTLVAAHISSLSVLKKNDSSLATSLARE